MESRKGGCRGRSHKAAHAVRAPPEQNKERYDLMLAMMGDRMLGWEGEAFAADELAATRQWLRCRANSIEGGTSEVQLNIIAKRILGLPD